jgi:UDP-N-acetylmuramyl pentapeptide synthase
VLEVGIGKAGQMAKYARAVQPDLAVVTSVGSEHNRFLKTLEITRHEKAEMVRALPPDGLAILNGDDPHVRWMASQTRARVVTFGFGEDNDPRASDYALDWPRGARFTLQVGGERHEVSSRLLGRHQVYAILAAVAVARAEGFSLDEALPRLAALEPTTGRLQPVRLENGAYLLRDDFKAGMETFDTALDVLAEIPAERRIVVLGNVDEPVGSMGPIYRRLGERAAGIADRTIIVGEQFRRYAAGARRAGLRREALVDAGRSARAATEAVRADLRPGDVVLIKGRTGQRLERVALALAGRAVRCDISYCRSYPIRCERCPMLERGWDGLRVVM